VHVTPHCNSPARNCHQPENTQQQDQIVPEGVVAAQDDADLPSVMMKTTNPGTAKKKHDENENELERRASWLPCSVKPLLSDGARTAASAGGSVPFWYIGPSR